MTDKLEDIIHSIYDNGGETCDRYTVYLAGTEDNNARGNDPMMECLTLSEKPNHPQGCNMFAQGVPGGHNGKQMELAELPPEIVRAIRGRLL